MLKFLSFLEKKEKPQYFLALLLRDEKANAVIFEEFQGKIQVKGLHEEYFKTSIEETSLDEFLEVLDKSISSAEANLPENIETQKTVFGVKENWVEDSKIKKDYLLKLKKASEALGLSPIGFLVIHEAIAHLLQKEEGAPVSAILTEIDKKNLAISIFRAGRIIETRRTKIEDSIPKTCDLLLQQFTNCEILPSRILIFDGRNIDKLQQEFVAHSWSKSLSFLHVPQITTLSSGFDAKAVLFGAATQMGFELLGDDSEKPTEENVENKVIEEIETFEGFKNEKDQKEEKKIEKDSKKPEEKTEDELGNSTKDEIEGTFQEASSFGFVKEKDVLGKTQKKKETENVIRINDNFSTYEENEITEKQEISKQNQPGNIFGTIKNVGVLNFIATILNFAKKIKMPKFLVLKTRKKIILLPLIAVILIAAGALIYLFGLKASITLKVNPKTVEQNKDLTFSTKSSDLSKNILAGEVISVSEDGEASIDVTGKKDVGTPAKGNITIYSRLTESKTFNAGTIIKSDKLEFTLDKALTVASSSADASASPSTGTVSVTASGIGKESNLPSGTKFSVGSFDASDVVAKNDSAFSGGTKKEITAVSKDDQNKLLDELPKDLESKAKDDINKQILNGSDILPVFITTNVSKKEFDHKIGDEAGKLTLSGTVIFGGISYKKNDLNDLSKNIISENLKEMTLSKEGIKYSLKEIKVKNKNEVTAKLSAKAFLLPKIDTQKIIDNLAGKSFDSANKILMSLPQVSDTEITFNPKIPFLPKLLPRLAKNIKIIIETNP